MMFQSNGKAQLGLGANSFRAPVAADLPFSPGVPPQTTSARKLGIGGLLTAALLAAVATPIMVAADMSGAIVAAPLFIAGIAVAAASLLGPDKPRQEVADPGPVPASNRSGDAALPLADLFDACAFLVSPAGCIVDGNDAGKTLTAMLAQRCDPPVLFDLLSSDSRSSAMAALKQRSRKPVEVLLRNGEARLLHVLAAEADNNAVALLSVAATIDAVAETKTARLTDAMLASVSHELRTPLNAIIGFSGVLENELFGALGTEKQREYVGLIQRSGRHLLSVVNDILDVSKIQAGAYELNCEQFLLDEVVDEAATMVRCQAEEKRINVAIEAPSGGTTILGDRRAMHQILVNLLANAVKFTDKGDVTLSWQRVGRDLHLAVSDTGIGIAKDQIGKLGKPFVQASCGLTRRYEGTGLGLAYVRGMCELHGGDMKITSEEGEGTRVMLNLPLVPRQAATIEDRNIVSLNHARTSRNPDDHHGPQRRTA